MKHLVSILILALVAVLSSASCKKTSSTGVDNGFACKINGKVWRPYSDDFKLREAECQVSQRGESVFIKAVNTKTFEHFAILVNSPGKIVTEGNYALNGDRFFIGLYDDVAGSGEFITGNGYEGEIEITKIDKVNSRISGKFYLMLITLRQINQLLLLKETSIPGMIYTSNLQLSSLLNFCIQNNQLMHF